MSAIAKQFNVLDLADTFPFGKYGGRTVLSVLWEDPGYIVWVDTKTKFKIKKRVVDTAQEKVSETARKSRYDREYDEDESDYDRDEFDYIG